MKKQHYFPSIDVFKEKARSSKIVPVFRDILADTDTPVSAFLKIDDNADAFLLESVEGGEKWGRYSLLGIKPRMVLRSKGDVVEIIDLSGAVPVTKTKKAKSLDAIKEIMAGYHGAEVARIDGLPRFYGGAIGYLGYDTVRQFEKLPDTKPALLDLYQTYFIFTDAFLVFDNVEHTVKVIANAYVNENENIEDSYNGAIAKIDGLIEKLRGPVPERAAGAGAGQAQASSAIEVTSNFTKADYKKAVEKTKEYILAGDIIQAVISQRFTIKSSVEPLDVYRMLRVINPSPYMFFLRLGGIAVVGSSPEILVRVEDGEVNVKPIAGTRKRGRDDEEDAALAKELLADPKEIAEHVMLVDLGRNDVGRVAASSTVVVDELMTVEKYSHVMHIVTNVHGRLKDGSDSFDALRACFPAGTLTGAAKVRAMEIIEELEPSKRELYGGSIGYFGYSGNMDMCIAIRTMVIKDGLIHIQAGAGIVADSVPEKEYEETENKAKALLKAVQMAEEGII